MSQQARHCPNCKQVNYGLAEFCQCCGADIHEVEADFLPWALSDQLPPMAYATRDETLFNRATDPDAPGTGWVAAGLLVVVLGLLIDLTPFVQVILTLAGLVSICWGMWELRVDYPALSRAGRWLIVLGILGLGIVSWRVIEPEAPNPTRLISASNGPKPTPTKAVATDGEMLMNRGGPAHQGVTIGPAPETGLYRSWRFDTGGELYSSPALSQNTLVVGSKSGYLYGLDATTGNQIWSREIGEYIVRSTPAITDTMIVINNGYTVLAVSLEDGSDLWSQSVSFTGSTSPTIVDDVVYIVSQNGSIYALDVATGAVNWKSQTDGLIFGSPTVDSGRIYIANDRGIVFGMRADNGTILWRSDVEGGVFAPIVSAGDTLYVTTAAGTTFALSAKFGSTIWKYDAGGSGGAALGEDVVIVAADDGSVSAIDRESGAITWSVATGAQITVGPTISGDIVLVASGQTLYAYDVETGAQVFTYATGNTIQIPPIAVNGLVFVGGRDGYLDAIAGDQASET